MMEAIEMERNGWKIAKVEEFPSGARRFYAEHPDGRKAVFVIYCDGWMGDPVIYRRAPQTDGLRRPGLILFLRKLAEGVSA
ncbi:MAG: hypothetical protein H0Z19_10360 [Archaeoglobus sp.]|uniref:hypothetical protein n=1 Tax=Archaeoglobus sp. TaxID=1872626 RepID=UPI001DFEEFE9|nr:hypothetical protein [Archaeoglobus sp.]MBO8180856.1 hypothetical protein [Archaeoglobus sp.]